MIALLKNEGLIYHRTRVFEFYVCIIYNQKNGYGYRSALKLRTNNLDFVTSPD